MTKAGGRKDDIAARVMGYIQQHHLKAGDRLPVRAELASELGVGSRRLREALSILNSQGIIETRNRGGTVVREPSLERLGGPLSWHLDLMGHSQVEVDNLRAVIEGAAAWVAARKRRARDLLTMLDAVERLEDDPTTWQEDMEAERDFHTAVLKATQNPMMDAFMDLIRTQLADETSRPRSRKVWHEINAGHRCIYEAIEQGDSVKAMDLMYEHVMAKQATRNGRRTAEGASR